MSAITGILYRDGRKVDPKLIKKMNETLSHRGPDGSAVYFKGSVGLGHQMLHTTHESINEKLPFHDTSSGLVITADARIDNRKELGKELNIEDNIDIPDSYFILKAYSRWGEKCPQYLLGDFAFVIWDENNEELFCARDHMGVKPFYYYLSNDIFVFGTEVRALFCAEEVPKKLNEDMAAMFLMVINDNKSTFYENIYSFSPAHSLTIGRKTNKKRKYWELDKDSQITMDSDEDYASKFKKLFAEAVECRLRSISPPGFELSGGIDSSSVLCMAKKILKEKSGYKGKINSFSYTFNGFECDESHYIKAVTDTGGIEPNFILGNEISFLEGIEKILWHQEQPVHTPYIAIMWNSYKKMHEKNMRVVLCGSGGDQVVSYGTNYFRDLTVTLKWKKLIKELYNHSKNKNLSLYRLFKNRVLFPLIPECLKKIIRPYYIKTSEISILNKKFAERIDAGEYLKELYWKPLLENNTAKKDHYQKITEDILTVLEFRDRTSSSFCIEPRYPFLDKRLVEFCYAVPTEIKFKFGWDRYILRAAMSDILPKEIQWRPDKSVLIPFYEKNFILFEKNHLDKIIFSKNEKIEEYVDMNLIKDIYKEYKAGDAESDSIYWLWLVSIMFLWLKK